MLRGMLQALKAAYPGLEGRAFVDTAPLAEKQLAVEAGLGWIGRQSLLVTPQFGSFVLLGELLLNDETDAYDTPSKVPLRQLPCLHRALPNGGDPRRADDRHGALHRLPHDRAGARHRDRSRRLDLRMRRLPELPPYNRRAPQHRNPAFDTLFDPAELDAEAWRALDERQFTDCFGTTPLTRSGLERIRGNIRDKR